MKQSLLLSLLLGLAGGTALAGELETPHISVYGTAVAEVVPDEMHWRLTVRSEAVEVTQTADQHQRHVAALLAFLKAGRIEEKKIQTSQMQLGENWEFNRGTRTQKGYFASTTVTFESDDLDQYQKLWMGLSRLAGVSVNGVSFDSSQRIRIQNETRIEALLAARAKAAELAAVLQVSLGGPLAIEEEPGGDDVLRSGPMLSNRMMEASAMQAEVSGESISPGTIPIRIRLRAVFALEAGEPD